MDNNVVRLARSRLREIYERIERGVKSFFKAIFMCGLLELPLRGHTDNFPEETSDNIFDLPDPRFGCFNGLLYIMMDAGDTGLIEHLDQSPQNAIYGSSRMQNRIVDIIRENLQNQIIQEARRSPYYSILADTTQDEGKVDQMSLVLRYITEDDEIVEQFLEYVDVSNSTTGIAIPNTALHFALEVLTISFFRCCSYRRLVAADSVLGPWLRSFTWTR